MPRAKKVSASPKVTRKPRKVAEKAVEKAEEGVYRLEVSTNGSKFNANADSLATALAGFVESPEFPFAIKTVTVIKYGKGDVERQRTLHVPAARRMFKLISTKPSHLALLAEKMANELA